MPLFVQDAQTLMYNVRDYGAKGDGVTDDTLAIQACINASQPGSTVFFPSPANFYGIGANGPIVFLPNRTYKGSSIGGNAPTIKQLNSINLTGLFVSYNYWNNQNYADGPFTLENLTFDGNSTNNGGSTCHVVIIQNSYAIIRACHFNNTTGAGILQTNATQNGTLVSNSIVENHIESCRFSTNLAGIWIRESGANVGTDGYIRDCVIGNSFGTSLAAIRIERGGGWWLSGNHIYNAQATGIYVATAWATSIVNNEIDGFGQSVSTTTLTNAISSAGSQSVQVGTSSNYAVNQYITIDTGANQETVQITAIADSTHVTCNFTKTHSAGVTIWGGTGAYYSGISVSTTNSRPSIVSNNIIATASEPNPNSHYQHMSVLLNASGGNNELLMANNMVYGAYVSSGAQNSGYSQAYTIQSNTNTVSNNIVAVSNRAANVGNVGFIDSNTQTAPVVVYSDIQLDRHFLASKEITSAPTLAALTNNGASPPTPIFSSLGGTDVRGKVQIGSGTSPSAGNQVSVTFAKSYGSIPNIIVSAMNAATAALVPYVDTTTQSTSAFNIAFANAPTASQSAGTYQVCYLVIG